MPQRCLEQVGQERHRGWRIQGGARVSSGSPCYQEENRAKHEIVSRLPFRFTKSFEESAVQQSSMLHASFHPHIKLVQLTSLLFNVQLETWGFRAFK